MRQFSSRRWLLTSAAALAFGLTASAASAQTAPPAGAAKPAGGEVSEVVITAQKLDAARATIQPQLGASTYAMSAKVIATLPGGDNTQLNQVILQAPGVAQDSYGQLHIRGEHNGLQFRLNGVILPEGLSVFSQALSPRLADKVDLITGALPAEYGLRTAGIVDITTKSGVYANGGEVSLYGGSHDEYEPSLEVHGSSGAFNFFASASYMHNDLGIESPDGRSDPLHDATDQLQGFAYLEDILNPDTRASLIVGSSTQRFQIPDVAGGVNGGLLYGPGGDTPLSVNGQTNYPSSQLNEQQRENTQYVVASLLRSTYRLTTQVSLFGRYSTLTYTPDVLGDLLYDGIAQSARKTDIAGGVQAEGSYQLNDAHTLRAGVIVEIDRATSATVSDVMLLDAATNSQIGTTPHVIVDDGARTAQTYSAYVQDEWKLAGNLTLNYGLRFDQFDGFRDENQLSPRVNLVWLPTASTTVHVGYSRYFTPPPFELVASQSIGKFVEPTGDPSVTTTAAPSVTKDTTPYAERANYFDVGVSQKIGRALSLGVDSYYKLSRHLIDEGQFGAPIILTPFNYERGRQSGIEFTGSYDKGPFSAYANFAYAVAQGEDWITSQFNFTQPALDYVKNHYVYLDHDQRYSASLGASYLWRGTRFGGDLIYGSGLRADLPISPTSPVATAYPGLTAIPNGAELKPYAQINLSISHRFDGAPIGPLEVRLDLINAFDSVYQIRNGTGIGVFAPQYGPRRGVFAGITQQF